MKVKSWCAHLNRGVVEPLTVALAARIAYGNTELTPLQVVEYLGAGFVVCSSTSEMHYKVEE